MSQPAPPPFYREADATLEPLAGARIAVVGYGNLGRSFALNLRDSGLQVHVGSRADASWERAVGDGFTPLPIAEATAEADVVALLVPDDAIPQVFGEQVAPALAPGSAVAFASGYALAFDLVEPASDVDVLLLAPRMLGEEVRASYRDGRGFLSYVSVEQDASGHALERLLALALAVGSLRRGALALSARQEATLDLFVEQAVGPYIGVAFQLAFALGVEAGLPPEAVVCELYMSGEMERVMASMARDGFFESVRGHGLVAAYGGYLGTQRIDHDSMLRHFRGVLDDLASGAFAQRLQQEREDGEPTMATIRALIDADNPLTAAERRVRARFNGA